MNRPRSHINLDFSFGASWFKFQLNGMVGRVPCAARSPSDRISGSKTGKPISF
jgi:hypothetical protein